MKLLLDCIDNGTIYKILGAYVEIQSNSEINPIIEGNKSANILYEIFSINIYQEILRNINEGKNVYIPKSLDKALELSDVIFQEARDPFELRKNEIIIRVRDYILTTGIRTDMSLAVMDFMMSFSVLANEGYFITETNRDEMYNKIIIDSTEKTDGVQLIKSLEKYLNSYTKINEIIAPYRNMQKFFEKIENIDNIDELNQEYENFMGSFS